MAHAASEKQRGGESLGAFLRTPDAVLAVAAVLVLAPQAVGRVLIKYHTWEQAAAGTVLGALGGLAWHRLTERHRRFDSSTTAEMVPRKEEQPVLGREDDSTPPASGV